MFFFKPLFVHHNYILLGKDDDLNSLIPVVPPSRFRFLVAAPTFIHHNTIKKVSSSDDHSRLAVEGRVYCDNNTGEVFDIRLVRNSSLVEQSSGVLEELGEKQQMKLSDQSELDEKWNQTKKMLEEAKSEVLQ